MKFGEKLQTLRKNAQMSQEDLATHLHVSRQAVSKWEREEGYPEIETLVMISEIFQVSLDFLFKDSVQNQENRDEGCFLSSKQLDELLKFKKIFAYTIASGVFAIIEGVALQPLIEQYNRQLADFLFMMIIALAVLAFVIIGLYSQKYKKFEEKKLTLHYENKKALIEEYEKFHTTFIIMIAIGVFLILMGVALFSIVETNEAMMDFLFLTLTAVSVFLFILAGIRKNTYQQLINYEEYLKNNKENQFVGQIYAVTMPLAALIYMIIGFVFEAWHPGWLIFPATAILTYSVVILKAIKDKNKL